MTQQSSRLESPAPKIDTSSQIMTLPQKASEPLQQAKTWNTKSLGLRLASDFISGFTAATLVAPLITIIDKGIMQNASGQATLKNSLKESLAAFVLRPHHLVFSKPFGLICMLYGGTYLTANTLDTITSTVQNRPATYVTSDTLKFAASSTANIGICLFKDQTFARLFGPGGPPRPVPLPSYALFTLRDCLTIFASFNVPPLLGPVISRNMSQEIQKSLSGQTIAQFLAPASVQIISTPMHLLGLDFYNRGQKGISWGDRWTIVKKNWGVSAVARMCRIVPAFGVGGVVNAKMRKGLISRLE
ncbi:putative membrane protein [Lachnellula occidentalis]|uniref:Putative membrane protein n=1 Tax=Lachnellula occidentalis TaxID=215460 RepID=A0A8H8RTZ1_9HELO|nr:putative membrane protein [Lachnellula occidentalis]